MKARKWILSDNKFMLSYAVQFMAFLQEKQETSAMTNAEIQQNTTVQEYFEINWHMDNL